MLDLAPVGESTAALIQRMCGLLTSGGERASLLVARTDEMLHDSVRLLGDPGAGLVHYFTSGASMADAIRQVFASDFGRVRLLDFAAGHGRITRFLLAPNPDVTVADIKKDAVRFQQQAFGVRGAVSDVSPKGFLRGERFDLITVTSLFTHLPKRAWLAWLEHLLGLLTPQGVLVFSTRGANDPPPHTFDDDGFWFEPTSESKELNAREYGTTWTTHEFITAAVGRFSMRSITRVPGGLLRHQDLYVVAPSTTNAQLGVRHGPRGWVDQLANNDTLLISGWAIEEDLTGPPANVALFSRGERLGAATTFTPRDDVAAALGIRPVSCAWRIETTAANIGDPLVVTSEGLDGRVSVLYVGIIPRARSS